MDEIAVGDIVQLKSGGPIMTVSAVEGGKAWCEWFDSAEPKHKTFVVAVLKRVESTGGFQVETRW